MGTGLIQNEATAVLKAHAVPVRRLASRFTKIAPIKFDKGHVHKNVEVDHLGACPLEIRQLSGLQ